MVTFLVVTCLVVWIISGPTVATVAGTTAVAIACIPQFIDTYREPWKSPLLSWSGFMIANALVTAGGAEWSIEERLYPAVCTLLTTAVVLLTVRRYWTKEPSTMESNI